MSEFQKFMQSQTDLDIQLIFKPHREGIRSLSKEEIQQYLDFNVPQMKNKNMSMKTIIVCEETQKFIKNNKDILLKNIINKEEEENER